MGLCRPISSIAASVAYTLGTPVLDQTSLGGLWNYQILFSPPQQRDVRGDSGILPSPVDAPPLTVALEEQLGFKLQTSRAPVHVLVIESVRRPTAN